MKLGRAWLPLDASYTRDPTILAAGEPAAWLFLAILGQIRLTGSPGTITATELNHLGISGVERRLQPLLRVGLVQADPADGPDDGPLTYWVPSWQAWQSHRDRAHYMREWRANRANPPPTNGAVRNHA